MEPVADWSKRTMDALGSVTMGAMRSFVFMRDPPRAVSISAATMLAPADGVVLHAVEADPVDALEVKGIHYQLGELLFPLAAPTEPCFVVGIFMSFYDVHINRMPTAGSIRWQRAEAIASYNRPMLFVEEDVLDDRMVAAYRAEGEYIRHNARNLCHVSNGELEYWMVQIADLDIDVIAMFPPRQGGWLNQGQRFADVRWGSQVELIVPARLAKLAVAQGWHVEAGRDVLLECV